MPDRERVISDKALGEDLLVALAGLVRLGKIVREVRADEFFPRNPCNLDGSLIDVGDLAVGADGDQRVEARLNQAAGVLGGLPLGGDITGGGKDP